jgi:exopolysaccharide production protein ExoZ
VAFKNVQGLRAVAVLLVVLAHVHDFSDRLHVPDAFAAFIPIGAWGVDLFFVISGFIMVVVHWNDFERPGSPLRFLVKRIIRIYPLYWVATFVLFVALRTVPGLTHHWMGASANVALSLLLLPQKGGALLFVAWTLTYEMYFYCVFATLMRWRRSWAFRALALWGGVILIAQLVPAIGRNPYGAVFFGNLVLEFICGALVGAAVVRGRLLPGLPTLAFGVLALAVTFAATLHGGTRAIAGIRFACVGLPMTAVVYGAVALEVRARRIVPSALQKIGDASYSIYLWHAIMFAALGRVLVGGHLGARIPAPILLTLAPAFVVYASIVLYHAIEIPLSRASRDLGAKLLPASRSPRGERPGANQRSRKRRAPGLALGRQRRRVGVFALDHDQDLALLR